MPGIIVWLGLLSVQFLYGFAVHASIDRRHLPEGNRLNGWRAGGGSLWWWIWKCESPAQNHSISVRNVTSNLFCFTVVGRTIEKHPLSPNYHRNTHNAKEGHEVEYVPYKLLILSRGMLIATLSHICVKICGLCLQQTISSTRSNHPQSSTKMT